MLADAEKPVLWDIVLVYAIDRFGRNSIEIALNKQKLKKNHKTLIEQCKHQNRLTKDKVISYLTDPLRQAPRRLIRALIEKIVVFDDKIQIFFKYTKTSPEDNPWEMPAYPGSDSSNMVDLRRILRANRAIFPCLSPCVALVPSSAG